MLFRQTLKRIIGQPTLHTMGRGIQHDVPPLLSTSRPRLFPTPLAKSTYSPVSGLKVVRRPSDSHKDSDGDSGGEGALDSASPHAQPYRAGPTTTITSGPSPMPAPPLLEAINWNALAVFLLKATYEGD
jgi:hypothetical protein